MYTYRKGKSCEKPPCLSSWITLPLLFNCLGLGLGISSWGKMGSKGTPEAGVQISQKECKAGRGGAGFWQVHLAPKPEGSVLQKAQPVGPASTPWLELGS